MFLNIKLFSIQSYCTGFSIVQCTSVFLLHTIYKSQIMKNTVNHCSLKVELLHVHDRPVCIFVSVYLCLALLFVVLKSCRIQKLMNIILTNKGLLLEKFSKSLSVSMYVALPFLLATLLSKSRAVWYVNQFSK